MPTSPKFATIVSASIASLLAVSVLAGCSSSTDPAATPTTTVAPASSSASSSSTTAASDGPSDGSSDASVPSSSDSESHTGDSPVVPAGATLSSGEAPADRTVTISKDGSTVSFSPATLTIKAGDNVTFKGAGTGTFAVIVPGLDGATVSGGLIETFVFPNTGTFTITEDISATTMTITVT